MTQLKITGFTSFWKIIRKAFKKRRLEDCTFVLIGDSFLRGVNADHGWGYYFKEALGSDATVYEYGNSGAGFCRKGHTEPLGAINFKGQLDYSKTRSGDVELVDYVILSGSGNDHNYNYNEVESAVISTVQYAKKLYPNATIVVLPLQNEYKNYNSTYINEAVALIRGGHASGALVCDKSWWWTTVDNGVYSSDTSHPNNLGYKIMGQNLVSFLRGSNPTPITYLGYGCKMGPKITSDGLRCMVIDGIVYLNGTIEVSSISNSTLLFTLPKSMRPNRTKYNMAMMTSSKGKQVTPLAFFKDGSVYCRTPDGGYPSGKVEIDIPDISYPLVIL